MTTTTTEAAAIALADERTADDLPRRNGKKDVHCHRQYTKGTALCGAAIYVSRDNTDSVYECATCNRMYEDIKAKNRNRTIQNWWKEISQGVMRMKPEPQPSKPRQKFVQDGLPEEFLPTGTGQAVE